jgi:hypothetical protein
MIEQILEKIVFTFTTIFVQPTPEWNPQEWLGMIFGIPPEGNFFKLGMLFKSQSYGKHFFECIRSWNYYQNKDSEDNIKISFIIESESEYSAYVYPSFERKSIKLAKKQSEMEMLQKRQLKNHEQLVMMAIVCKCFPNPPNSIFRLFRSRYKTNDPFEFGAYFLNSDIPELKEGRPFIAEKGEIELIPDINPVIKFHLKIAKRDELSKKDIEYQHGKIIMGK